jgi:hypothetical protein
METQSFPTPHAAPLTEGLERTLRVGIEPSDVAAFMKDVAHLAVHNFTGDQMRIYQMTALATSGGIRSRDIPPDAIVPVKHWYMHWIEMQNSSTGDAQDQIRVALITPTNEVYGFVSTGIAQAVLQMVEAFGVKPFHPPIEVYVKRMETRRGMTILTLIPVVI